MREGKTRARYRGGKHFLRDKSLIYTLRNKNKQHPILDSIEPTKIWVVLINTE